MKITAMKPWMLLLCLLAAPLKGNADSVRADNENLAEGLQGYAGPGWTLLFDLGGAVEIGSVGPLMFRLSETAYLGPLIVYEESASEGPSSFLGGIKLEGYFSALSTGFYSTSAAVSVLAGAGRINSSPCFTTQLNSELSANFLILPALNLAVGPIASLRLIDRQISFLPGLGFSLKEGSRFNGNALIDSGEDDPKIHGRWQGLWIFMNSRSAFVDGGGTGLEWPIGLSIGICGGVLRQKIEQERASLAIMLSGVFAEWNFRLTEWLSVTPRVTTGVAMYGWAAYDGTMDGGPHFMIRPEICLFLGVLPFLEIGGGIGCHLVAGEPQTSIPLGPLSSLSFNIEVRTGER
jgi:hypothetical protein